MSKYVPKIREVKFLIINLNMRMRTKSYMQKSEFKKV